MIVFCMGLLSLRKVLNGQIEKSQPQEIDMPSILGIGNKMPEWLPLILAIVFTFQISLQVIHMKNMTAPDKGFRFDITNMTMSGITMVNTVVFSFAIWFWQQPQYVKSKVNGEYTIVAE